MLIHKYRLDIIDNQIVHVPKGAKLLDIQVQDEGVYAWFMFDVGAIKRPVQVFMTGTGNPFDLPFNFEHKKTVQAGIYVWHFFMLKGT